MFGASSFRENDFIVRVFFILLLKLLFHCVEWRDLCCSQQMCKQYRKNIEVIFINSVCVKSIVFLFCYCCCDCWSFCCFVLCFVAVIVVTAATLAALWAIKSCCQWCKIYFIAKKRRRLTSTIIYNIVVVQHHKKISLKIRKTKQIYWKSLRTPIITFYV